MLKNNEPARVDARARAGLTHRPRLDTSTATAAGGGERSTATGAPATPPPRGRCGLPRACCERRERRVERPRFNVWSHGCVPFRVGVPRFSLGPRRSGSVLVPRRIHIFSNLSPRRRRWERATLGESPADTKRSGRASALPPLVADAAARPRPDRDPSAGCGTEGEAEGGERRRFGRTSATGRRRAARLAASRRFSFRRSVRSARLGGRFAPPPRRASHRGVPGPPPPPRGASPSLELGRPRGERVLIFPPRADARLAGRSSLPRRATRTPPWAC